MASQVCKPVSVKGVVASKVEEANAKALAEVKARAAKAAKVKAKAAK